MGREVSVVSVKEATGSEIVRVAQDGEIDLIVLPLPVEPPAGGSRLDGRAEYVLDHAHCRVFLAASPRVPQEVEG
jgi:hypothetical protein